MPEHADIIVVSHNGLGALRECIDSIRRETTYPYRLTVVDNGSDVATLRYLRAQDDLTRIENRAYIGYAAALNRGIESGRGQSIVILRADVKVTQGWLEPLISTLWSDEAIAVVGPKVLNEQNEVVRAGAVGTEVYFQMRGGDKPNGPGVFDEYTDCVTVCSACYVIKRSLIPVLGLFDTAYFSYFENIDYSFRARSLGYRVVYCPDSSIYSFEHALSNDLAQLQFYFAQSRATFEAKWAHKLCPPSDEPSARRRELVRPKRVRRRNRI